MNSKINSNINFDTNTNVNFNEEDKIVDLDKAIESVKSTIRSRQILDKNKNYECPYFFFVGAGISMPEIKGSYEIIEDCKNTIKEIYEDEPEKIKEFYDTAEKKKGNTSSEYSYWFEAAYPEKSLRQKFLKKIIKDSKISSANLLLAEILLSKKISNFVITTNFDDKIYQALGLLGERNVFIANNPTDNLGFDISDEQIQIVHVHGTYHFYDCSNLESEIKRVSNNNQIQGSSFIINELLKHKSPIVIGYSGWEDDVFMTQLKDRIYSNPPYKTFWFCYNKNDFIKLPSWLKNSEEVIFVLPKEFEDCEDDNNCSSLNCEYIKFSSKKENVLKAEKIFNKLISTFNIPTPFAFSNPFEHYLQTITASVEDNKEILYLKRWAKRVNGIKYNITNDEKLIEQLENSVLKNNVEKTIKNMQDIILSETLEYSDLFYILSDVINPYIENLEYDQKTVLLYKEILRYISIKEEYINNSKCIKKTFEIILRNIEKEEVCSIDILKDMIIVCENKDQYLYIELCCKGIMSNNLNENDKFKLREQIFSKALKSEDEEILHVALTALSKSYFEINDEEKQQQIKEIIKNEEWRFLDSKSNCYSYYLFRLDMLEIDSPTLSEIDNYIISVSKVEQIDPIKILIIKAYILKTTFDIENKLEIIETGISLCNSFENKNCINRYILSQLILMKLDFLRNENNVNLEPTFLSLCKLQEELPDCKSILKNTIQAYTIMIQVSRENRGYIQKCIELMQPLINESSILKQYIILCESLCFKFLSDEEKKDFYIKNSIYKEYFENVTNLSKVAYENFIDGNVKLSITNFLSVYNYQIKLFGDLLNNVGINLAFLKRKENNFNNIIDIPIKKLLKEDEYNYKNAFLLINKSLCYLTGFEYEKNIEKGLIEFQKIDEDINSAIEWWKNEKYVGKEESALVLYLLLHFKKVNKIEGYNEDDLAVKCKEYFPLVYDHLNSKYVLIKEK